MPFLSKLMVGVLASFIVLAVSNGSVLAQQGTWWCNEFEDSQTGEWKHTDSDDGPLQYEVTSPDGRHETWGMKKCVEYEEGSHTEWGGGFGSDQEEQLARRPALEAQLGAEYVVTALLRLGLTVACNGERTAVQLRDETSGFYVANFSLARMRHEQMLAEYREAQPPQCSDRTQS